MIITWVYLSTGGSVLIVMLLHLSSNVIGGGIFMPLFSGPDQVRFYQLVILFAWILALVLLFVSRKKLARQANTAGAEAQGSTA
jgi:cadmium resistance protein CadD (predicted permease)